MRYLSTPCRQYGTFEPATSKFSGKIPMRASATTTKKVMDTQGDQR